MGRYGLVSAAASALVCGCDHRSDATDANYIQGLNAYYAERSECLFRDARFPLETSDAAQTKRLDTLVAAQMLEVSREREIHVSRYTPTPAGALAAPHFCYGRREVTAIDSATPPAVANGFNETQVTFHYAIRNVPVWAKSAAVQAAFPEMAGKVSGQPTDKATLAQTRVGWQVPD